jgi:O-antigen/teichoic acid export membrane protein
VSGVTESEYPASVMAALLEAARRRNPLPSGTAAVGVGLIVAGLSAYGTLFVANKALSDVQYSPLGALWSLVFLAGPGLFLPFEQEISRALAERRARRLGGAPVVRRAGTLGLGLLLGVLVLLILSARWLVEHLFDGQIMLLVGLALGVAGALAGHVTRGCMSGTGHFRGYGTYLGADGFIRVLGAVVCLVAGVTIAGPFGIAIGIAGLLAVPVALRVEKPELEEGPEAALSEVGSALLLLLIASLCAFAIMNIGPVLVKLLADDTQSAAAGRFVNGVVVARIPLFLFQAVQASLLPKLSGLAHSGQLGDFRYGLRRLLVAVAGLAFVGTVAGAVLGPFVVQTMFPGSDLGARTMGLLAAGAGLYMLAMACAQALIALGGHADQAAGWFLGCVALAITVLISSEDVFFRVELSLFAGSAVSLIVMGVLLIRRLTAAGPLHVDSGDFVEAIHDVAIEP